MTHKPSLNVILTATAVVTMGVAALCIVPAWSSADESQRDAGTSAAPGSDLLVSARGGGGRGGGGARGGGGRGGGGAARAGGGGRSASYGGGGGGRNVRSGASSSVNHRVEGNRNVNRNTNRNVNRNTNVNVNNGNCCGGGWNNGWDDHPFATGAAIAAGAAVVGSMVNSVPANCGTVNVNGIDYYQCGNTWYQPQYAGTSVQYAVVSSPQ